MHTANFEEALDEILKKDPRYHRDAYRFVREALDHTQKMLSKGGKSEPRQGAGEESSEGKVRDVTGQELLGLRGHGGAVTSVAFSPDGQRLASAS